MEIAAGQIDMKEEARELDLSAVVDTIEKDTKTTNAKNNLHFINTNNNKMGRE